jgi:hypothetical protein
MLREKREDTEKEHKLFHWRINFPSYYRQKSEGNIKYINILEIKDIDDGASEFDYK